MMSDFKVGDIVFWIEQVLEVQEIISNDITIWSGTIVNIENQDDFPFADIEVSSINGDEILTIQIYLEATFESKQDCIDAFKKRLDEL